MPKHRGYLGYLGTLGTLGCHMAHFGHFPFIFPGCASTEGVPWGCHRSYKGRKGGGGCTLSARSQTPSLIYLPSIFDSIHSNHHAPNTPTPNVYDRALFRGASGANYRPDRDRIAAEHDRMGGRRPSMGSITLFLSPQNPLPWDSFDSWKRPGGGKGGCPPPIPLLTPNFSLLPTPSLPLSCNSCKGSYSLGS